jgi:hypothetical protein
VTTASGSCPSSRRGVSTLMSTTAEDMLKWNAVCMVAYDRKEGKEEKAYRYRIAQHHR